MPAAGLVSKIAKRLVRKLALRRGAVEVRSFAGDPYTLQRLRLVPGDGARPLLRITPRTLTRESASGDERLFLDCELELDLSHPLIEADPKLKAALAEYLQGAEPS